MSCLNNDQKMKIILIGLSNKPGLKPFDSCTNSGKIIDQIIEQTEDEFYKMNLVPYAPLDQNKKLRYPKAQEIEKEIPSLKRNLDQIQPDIIIGFGSIVGNYLKKIKGWEDRLIIAKHPSYMAIYKRKELDQYINDIVFQIKQWRN